jgi:hypothetical protein
MRVSFGEHYHFHNSPWDDAPPWAIELREMCIITLLKMDQLMSTQADLEAALSVIDGKVTAVKADVDGLLAKLAAIPTPGMTPEQQAALDAAVVHANAIAASLGAIDTTVNPPAAAAPAAP